MESESAQSASGASTDAYKAEYHKWCQQYSKITNRELLNKLFDTESALKRSEKKKEEFKQESKELKEQLEEKTELVENMQAAANSCAIRFEQKDADIAGLKIRLKELSVKQKHVTSVNANLNLMVSEQQEDMDKQQGNLQQLRSDIWQRDAEIAEMHEAYKALNNVSEWFVSFSSSIPVNIRMFNMALSFENEIMIKY